MNFVILYYSCCISFIFIYFFSLSLNQLHCISIHDDFIFVGCTDGGLRLIPVGSDGLMDYNPQLWKAFHGKESPALTSISVSQASSGDYKDQTLFTCATGAEDGTVVISDFLRPHP